MAFFLYILSIADAYSSRFGLFRFGWVRLGWVELVSFRFYVCVFVVDFVSFSCYLYLPRSFS